MSQKVKQLPDESFKQQLKKKVLELKSDSFGFYTETYNLVSVMNRLSIDAPPVINERMSMLYRHPSEKFKLNLPQLEELYAKFKLEPNLRTRGKIKLDVNDVKRTLDRVRRDLLFYLAVIEDKPKDYNIILEKEEVEKE